MKTIRDLKLAMAKTGVEIDYEDVKPNAEYRMGSINLVLGDSLAFASTGTWLAMALYDEDIKGSRSAAIASLIKSIEQGIAKQEGV
jgi:hypothetical protein